MFCLQCSFVGYKTLSVENFDLVQYFSGKNAITDGARAETGLGLSSKAQVLAKACSKGLSSRKVSKSMHGLFKKLPDPELGNFK